MNKQEKIDAIYKEMGNYDIGWDYIMIGNILKYLYELQEGEFKKYEDNSQFPQIILKLLDLFNNKDKKIERQSEECIDYIYNLINNEKTSPRGIHLPRS